MRCQGGHCGERALKLALKFAERFGKRSAREFHQGVCEGLYERKRVLLLKLKALRGRDERNQDFNQQTAFRLQRLRAANTARRAPHSPTRISAEIKSFRPSLPSS